MVKSAQAGTYHSSVRYTMQTPRPVGVSGTGKFRDASRERWITAGLEYGGVMGKHGTRRTASRQLKARGTGHGWIRYMVAMGIALLVGSMVLFPDVSSRVRGRTLAAGLTPPPMPSPTATLSAIIGGLGVAPPTAAALPTATDAPLPTDVPASPTPLPPTATPLPTVLPTATPVPPTATPSGPTPTPDRGVLGTATPVYGAIPVPVLMYHYIRVNPDPRDAVGFGLSVTPTDFAAQMDWLVTNGYHTVLPVDLRHALTDGASLPTKPILLTFDDGYRDFYDVAWPVLQQYGLKASVAIITAYADKGDAGDELYMNWDMVRTLDASGMVEVASHTVFHADLTRATAAQRFTELSQSKAMLEDKLAHSCDTFVYPSGMFNAAVVADAARVGYSIAFTTQSGTVRAPTDNGRMLTLPRVRISGGETLAAFAKDLG